MAPVASKQQGGGAGPAPPPQVRQYLQALLSDGGAWATVGGGKKQSENKAAPGAWCCMFSDCKMAERRVPNFSTRALCRGCGRLKAHAMSPPAAFKLPPAEPTRAVRGDTAEAKRNAVPGAGRPGAKGRTGGTVTAAKSDQGQAQAPQEQRLVGATFGDLVVPQPAAETRELQVAADVAKRLGITPLKDADISELFRLPPPDPPELRSVDDIVAKAPPVEASAHVEKLQAKVANSRQLLTLMDPDTDDLYDSVKTRLATLEAELDRSVKRAPGSTLLAAQLTAAKQKEVVDKTKWEEVNTNGATKAAEKLQTHLNTIDAQMAALQERRRLVTEQYEKSNMAWRSFNSRKRQQWESVLAQFDTRIATAAMLPPVPDASTQNPLALVLAASAAAPPPAVHDPLLQAREDAAKAQARVAAFEKERRRAMEVPAHLRSLVCEMSDLPTMLPEPAAEEWELYHLLWGALESLSKYELMTGEFIPVTFDHLRAGLTLPKLLLGDKLWDMAFPGTQPGGETVVTCQLRRMLWNSLQIHKDKLVADKLKHDEAVRQATKGIDDTVTEYRAKRKKTEDAAEAGC